MSVVSYTCMDGFPALYINLVIVSLYRYVVLQQCKLRRFGSLHSHVVCQSVSALYQALEVVECLWASVAGLTM